MSYTRPDGDAADFALTGYTAPGGTGVQARFPASSYTAPTGNNINAQFGAAYTRPLGDAVDFSFEPPAATVPEGVVAFSVDVTFDVAAEHDEEVPAGVVDFSVSVTFDVAAEHELPIHEAEVAFTVDVSAQVQASHGITGTAEFAVDVSAEVEGVHGITGTAAFTIDVSVDVTASHPRYVLKGEVRDGGVLVNRTVRAYLRSSGALIGEQLTDAGRFDIHAGWAPAEHYLLPIDLDSGATDFTPPAANRVLSVLAED